MHKRLGAQRLFQRTAALAAALAVAGCWVTLGGGAWDASSHALREPESFWTVQHLAVYAGVSLSVMAALAARSAPRALRKGAILVVAGAALQVVAGAADSVSHELFGIDGLVSASHQPLEAGLVVSSAGALMLSRGAPRVLAVPAALALAASSLWLAFNLALIPAAVLLCMPVYALFSSGCAVM